MNRFLVAAALVTVVVSQPLGVANFDLQANESVTAKFNVSMVRDNKIEEYTQIKIVVSFNEHVDVTAHHCDVLLLADTTQRNIYIIEKEQLQSMGKRSCKNTQKDFVQINIRTTHGAARGNVKMTDDTKRNLLSQIAIISVFSIPVAACVGLALHSSLRTYQLI